MKIGLITTSLDQKKYAGFSNYVSHLIMEFKKINSKNKYYLIHYNSNPECKLYTKENNLLIPISGVVFKKFLWYFFLPFHLKKNKIKILHGLTQTLPFFKLKGMKYVMTVHDLTTIILPKTHKLTSFFKDKLLLSHMLKISDLITTNSISTKNDIIKHFKISPDKIKVVYHAYDDKTYHKLSANEKKISEFKKKYSINYDFFLFVGTMQPRKNIITILKAMILLKESNELKHKLVIIGAKGWKYSPIFSFIKENNLEEDVRFMNYIPNEDLKFFYNFSKAFVWPSLYEGFGIPPLEAMACGTPVITSKISSMPEILGDAASYIYPPTNYSELAKKMIQIIKDKDLRQELIKKGFLVSSKYGWSKTAKKTEELYENLL